MLDVTSAQVSWKLWNTEDIGITGDTEINDVTDNVGNVDGVEIVFSPTNTISYSVLPVTNPLDQSKVLTNLLPFTPYQVMARMTVTNMTHIARILVQMSHWDRTSRCERTLDYAITNCPDVIEEVSLDPQRKATPYLVQMSR